MLDRKAGARVLNQHKNMASMPLLMATFALPVSFLPYRQERVRESGNYCSRHNAQPGFSLIELIIGLVIVGIMLMLGMPAFSSWIQNAQLRTGAESVLNGLQLARNEAVRRNSFVRFSLTDASGNVAWNVGCVNVTADCPATIQRRTAREAGGSARVGVSTTALPSPVLSSEFATPLGAGSELPAGITFDGLGRMPAANAGTDLTWIDVSSVHSAQARRMVVMVTAGGQPRMCDPALAVSDNPQGCGATP